MRKYIPVKYRRKWEEELKALGDHRYWHCEYKMTVNGLQCLSCGKIEI